MEKNKKRAKSRWENIMRRCYNASHQDYAWYGAKGVRVADEWHNFENFWKWYNENYYEVKGEYMAVDKDILGDGTLYSPNTCLIIPFKINGMLVHKENGDMRGLKKRGGGFEVKVRNTLTGKNEYKGKFSTVTTAKKVYLECKNIIFQAVIDEYESVLPLEVYKKLKDFKL